MPRFLVLALFSASSFHPLVLAQEPPERRQPTTVSIDQTDLFRRPFPLAVLVGLEEVQREIKLSDLQRNRLNALDEQSRQQTQNARSKYVDREIFQAALDGIRADHESVILKALQPTQRDRLQQIQLQVLGPLAFERRELRRALRLSSDQVEQIEAIVGRGMADLSTKSSVPLELDTTNEPPTADSIRRFVQRLEFQLAKEKARQLAAAHRIGVLLEITKVLSESQQAKLSTMLGAPFDVPRPPAGPNSIEQDVRLVARRLGLVGQRADIGFSVKIARPAYAGSHPRVLIDEAHHNFHTRTGRYNVFGDLLANDGYDVGAGKFAFTTDALKQCEILVIANAISGELSDRFDETKPAFTSAECAAVESWVKAGGSLLLVTDHPPYGAAAAALAARFGVDMSKAMTIDPSNCDQNRPARLIFTREKALLGDHPITRGRDRSEELVRIMTFTGQSLKGPPGSVPILKLADTAEDMVEGKPVSAAGRSQGLALRCGKGRVVVMGDAAELSAQVSGIGQSPDNMMGMNVPGIDNRQMALNIMHWLSGLLEP
jgi:hypothetical protein